MQRLPASKLLPPRPSTTHDNHPTSAVGQSRRACRRFVHARRDRISHGALRFIRGPFWSISLSNVVGNARGISGLYVDRTIFLVVPAQTITNPQFMCHGPQSILVSWNIISILYQDLASPWQVHSTIRHASWHSWPSLPSSRHWRDPKRPATWVFDFREQRYDCRRQHVSKMVQLMQELCQQCVFYSTN